MGGGRGVRLRRCRHCERLVKQTRRGICRRCGRDPATRARYASEVSAAWRGGVPDRTGAAALAEPAPAAAGTPGKVAVMAGRVARGLSPFHPQDGPARDLN